ncbi:hypothetical protein G5I_13801 [Acromyrmex echinatior]|uniref:Uncharacterized protein n=1 Tax=Acromyrmex echinatior TaxID=103372 RepID=F4X605_ACREC|nr:hypothetical protein G5I_13801 [Acromyrmex echinatior]
MGIKPFRPTEGKHAEETQLRPKGRLSAFNDKKAKQSIQCKSRDVIGGGCATRRQVLAGVNVSRHLKCMVTDRGVFIGRSRNGARQQYKSNRSELECRVDDTVRERDARHSNKWIDSCKLRIHPYLSISLDAMEHAARDQENFRQKNPPYNMFTIGLTFRGITKIF